MTEPKILILSGGAWACAPVTETPEVFLEMWRIFEASTGESTTRTRYFVGRGLMSGHGRVSTAIVLFDIKARRGVTSSGRRYELKGQPGYDPDAMYTWDRWVAVNSATNVVDVTAEIEAQLLQG